MSAHFIEIDEEGYFKLEGLRVADIEAGRSWLANLQVDERGRLWTKTNGAAVIVEAFDPPYIALDVAKEDSALWTITMPYGHTERFALTSLRLDEWDRFHGRTERGISFVFSRAGQDHFFNLLDEFDDESVTINGTRYETRPLLSDNAEAAPVSFWSGLYKAGDTRWDLGGPAPALPGLTPHLKLQRARILVPGAGSGNDAAWFAQQGHIVTAVDFSEEAVARARAKYGEIAGLKFVQADVFNLPANFTGAFDIVFEHTLYCAIPPSRRAELGRVWRRVLAEHGHLLGIFATMDRPNGPPYGATEWELRERLRNSFRSLYWTRLREPRIAPDGTMPDRLGKELFIYAQKLPSLR